MRGQTRSGLFMLSRLRRYNVMFLEREISENTFRLFFKYGTNVLFLLKDEMNRIWQSEISVCVHILPLYQEIQITHCMKFLPTNQ